MTTTWHPADGAVRAYAHGALPEAESWSVEAHLGACPRCRGLVAHAVAGTPVAAMVRGVGERLVLPPQPSVPAGTRWRRSWLMARVGPAARGPYLLAVASIAVTAVLLDVLGPQLVSGASWVAALAPVLPALGVAASYGPGADPLHEVTAATPRGGLYLLLWRTLTALVVSVPLAAVLGAGAVLAGSSAASVSPSVWLLPALALTTATLALGTVLPLPAAAAVLGSSWLVAVAGPSLSRQAPVVLEPGFAPLWLTVAGVAGVALVARRGALSRTPDPR